jgi:hypothetical protein
MARKKDLGGLAALAGLAYMASRDKAATGPASSAPSAAPAASSADGGGDFIEAGSGPSGDFMSEKEPGWDSGTAPSRSTAAKTKRPAGGTANARDELLKRQGRYSGNSEEGMRNYVPRRSAAQQIAGMDDTYDPKVRRGTSGENRGATGETFKKGGSVKGWGIARGSRKAKTY